MSQRLMAGVKVHEKMFDKIFWSGMGADTSAFTQLHHLIALLGCAHLAENNCCLNA